MLSYPKSQRNTKKEMEPEVRLHPAADCVDVLKEMGVVDASREGGTALLETWSFGNTWTHHGEPEDWPVLPMADGKIGLATMMGRGTMGGFDKQ